MDRITFDDAEGLAAALRGMLDGIPKAPATGPTQAAKTIAEPPHRPGRHDELWATAVDRAALPLVPFAVAMNAQNAYAGRYREDAMVDLGHSIGTTFDGNPRHATATVARALAVARRQLAIMADRLAGEPDEIVMGVVDDDREDGSETVEILADAPKRRRRTISASMGSDGVWTDYKGGLRFERRIPNRHVGTRYGKHAAVVLAEPADHCGQRLYIHDETDGATMFLALFGIERRTAKDEDAWYEMPENGQAMDRHQRAAVMSHALNCYVLGQGALDDANAAAPLRGEMTWFDDASNAERDRLLAHLVAGGTATVRAVTDEHATGSGKPEAFVVELDGTAETFQGNAAFRLIHAEHAELRRDWDRTEMGPPPPAWPRTLRLRPGAKPSRHDLEPARTAVLFDAFQNGCSYRRHPQTSDGRECTHRKSGYNDYCDSAGCPLTEQIYSGDRERHARDDDPYFERETEREGLVLVQALTPQVRGSRAYRAAGVARVAAIVNRCANAVYQTGGKTSRYLTMGAEELAGFEAVTAGHLVVDERTTIGTIFQLSDALQAQMDERYRRAVAAQATTATNSAGA